MPLRRLSRFIFSKHSTDHQTLNFLAIANLVVQIDGLLHRLHV